VLVESREEFGQVDDDELVESRNFMDAGVQRLRQPLIPQIMEDELGHLFERYLDIQNSHGEEEEPQNAVDQ
jgi:hypothetical protein